MAYGANILKNEAAYYSLQNASILGGVLHINAGGSATQQITVSDLPKITDTLQFTCISDDYSDRYDPDVTVLVHARLTNTQKYYNAVLFPVRVNPNKYECVFTLAAGEYDEMYITIAAERVINMTLWELCAVAADEDIDTIIDGVKQSLPRLLYDYNTFPLEIGQNETTVAVITARLLQNTDLQGHFLMTFLASKTATLTLRFYDNEAEELFAPLYYDTRVGYNSVGVPHAYMNRLAGLHSFVVTAQIASGILTIDTRHTLFTIDGGYLAIRELEIGMDITDIAIRQLASDNGPDQIWCIGLDAGEALIRYRDYAEKNANVGWTAVGSLGRAVSAAIEFDGTWELRFGAEQFTLNTEEEPWYFWVNELGELYACHGLPSELNVPERLAVAVASDIKAVRGYSSIDYIENDQGLIVAYIKYDGFAYYRTYSYNATAHKPVWEEEQRLPAPGYIYDSINVHRLNDYRVGFELSGLNGSLWIISTRTFVGQSAFPENYTLAGFAEEPDMYITFLGYYPATYTPPVPVVSDKGTDYYETEERVVSTEEHYFEYDYSTDRKVRDMGTVDDFVEQYGQPSQDASGRLYVVVDTNTIYVKKFTVENISYETRPHWVYWFTIDRALWASQVVFPLFDRFTYNSSVRPENVEDIEWEYDRELGYTKIAFTMREKPSQLVTTFTLKASQYMRMWDGLYVTMFLDSLSCTFDYTNYITHEQPGSEAYTLRGSEATINYVGIIYHTRRDSDEYTLTGGSLVNSYTAIAYYTFTETRDGIYNGMQPVATIGYYKSGDEPI